MTMLVSLERASAYVRRDTTADDAELLLLIEAASDIVIGHLASGPSVDYLDSDGQAVTEDSDGVAQDVPPQVQAATLYLMAWLYRHRDEDTEQAFTNGWLPEPVRAMLGHLRDHVMA